MFGRRTAFVLTVILLLTANTGWCGATPEQLVSEIGTGHGDIDPSAVPVS